MALEDLKTAATSACSGDSGEKDLSSLLAVICGDLQQLASNGQHARSQVKTKYPLVMSSACPWVVAPAQLWLRLQLQHGPRMATASPASGR